MNWLRKERPKQLAVVVIAAFFVVILTVAKGECRELRSSFPFKVYRYIPGYTGEGELLGETSPEQRVSIPVSDEYAWYVRPKYTSAISNSDFVAIVDDLKRLSIPGLELEECKFVNSAGFDYLKTASGLRLLKLVYLKKGNTEAALASAEELPSIETLEVHYDHFNSQIIRHLNRMRALKTLVLRAPLSDADFFQLDELSQLRTLYLDRPNITDQGVLHLKAFPQLRVVSLVEAGVTSAALAHLIDLPRLTELHVVRCKNVNDEGMAYVGRLQGLQMLRLDDSAFTLTPIGMDITDMGLAKLTNLKSLKRLELDGLSHITDAGMDHIAKLEGLEMLRLVSMLEITDEGLGKLRNLRNLHRLELHDMFGTTRDIVRHLEQSMEGLHVQRTSHVME